MLIIHQNAQRIKKIIIIKNKNSTFGIKLVEFCKITIIAITIILGGSAPSAVVRKPVLIPTQTQYFFVMDERADAGQN